TTSGGKPTSTSGNPASTTSKDSSSSTTSSTSSVAPDPETYYSAPYEAGYESAKKWEKGHEYKFTFSVPKNYTKVVFAFGAQMSSSSHGSRSLYTDHNGASSDDSFESNEANDGTCRIVVKVNGVEQEVAHDTYEEAGLTNSEINYFKVSEFAVNAGDVVVSMTTHAKAGYRLMLGEGARLYYKAADESATPVVPVDEGEGYAITFSATHGDVWVYESGQDYTQLPVKTNTTESRDEDGKKTKWIEPEETDTKEPQVNFKVVCEAGYEIDADCFAITGEFNKIKVVSNDAEENSWIVRITKIKSDLTIVITPKVHVDGINGYEITFALTNATAKVYVGPKDETGSNVDNGEEGKFYTRAKTDPYDYSKSEPQFNFEIIPNDGYEFNDGVEWGEATEMSSSAVSFIAPSANYNKLKKSANGGYTLTKVAGALTITAEATQIPPQTQAIVLDYTGLTNDKNSEITTDALAKLGQGNEHVTAVTASKIYCNTGSGGAYPNANGMVKGGTGSANGVITFTLDVDVTKVEIKCHDFYKKDADHPTNSNSVKVNDLTEQLAPYNEEATFGTLTFELAAGSKSITITTQKRVYIQEIKLS
ncbi:MAG: hypothetical protein J5617_01275, partial [Bacilli bacterium]|nr:hypothetical protein [Bacilli bacterium]